MKSPSSATIRTGGVTPLELVKNHVDYVVLSLIYQQRKDRYENLAFSSEVTKCQRTVKVTREISSARNKTETVISDSHQGYILAERLSSYVSKRVGKSPEAEPFFRFVFEIIRLISGKISSNYSLPKSYFAPPSVVMRKQLRQGPAIKLKDGTLKGNTYVPFSFAKSSECLEMPETLRKTLTSTGASISKQIDSINMLELNVQSDVMSDAIKYISLCYAFSDELRKAWQMRAEILKDQKDLELFTQNEIFSFSYEERKSLINEIAEMMIRTIPLYDDETKQSSLKKKIAESVDSRKKSRKTSS
jgi:hypothetical protein